MGLCSLLWAIRNTHNDCIIKVMEVIIFLQVIFKSSIGSIMGISYCNEDAGNFENTLLDEHIVGNHMEAACIIVHFKDESFSRVLPFQLLFS